MQVTEYDAGGFEVQGDVYIPCSIVISAPCLTHSLLCSEHLAQVLLSHTAYLWRARTIEDITLESLRIFTIVHPRPGDFEYL